VLQALQQLAHVAVGEMQRVQVVGILVAGHGTVVVVRSQLQLRGVHQFGLRLLPGQRPPTALVRLHDGDVGEERLAGLALLPVDAVEEVVLVRAVQEEVQIHFAAAAGAVERLALGAFRL
jgi:hypothetical protein